MFEVVYKRILLIIAIITCSCTEVVDVDLPTSEPRLVIEASFNRFISDNSNPSSTEGFIRLTTTAPFFDERRPVVDDAQVQIYDPVNDITYIFNNQRNTGIYVSNFVPEFGIDYMLEINYLDEVYQATERMQPTGELVSAVQVPLDDENSIFDEDDKRVNIVIQDSIIEGNYYLIDLDKGNFITTNDRFYNGQEFDFSYFYEDLNVGDTLTIKALGVDKRFSQFMETLLAQSGQNGGGPFATAAATIRGNIVNTTNSDNFPLGYFRISEMSQIQVGITE